jgi:DNA-binding transcriptional ArsR family regulator
MVDSEAAIEALSALAHPGRLAAFRLLVQAGPRGLAAGEVARRLAVPPNTLSTQLAILSRGGLIRAHREGRSIIYRADYASFSSLLGFLVKDCCGGRPEVCAPLAQAVRSTTGCGQGQALREAS